jgi:hypothetical protein
MEQISKRGEQMKKLHDIEKVSFDKNRLFMTVDGREYTFLLTDISRKLAGASAAEREKYQISPSGYGISWPLIDEDLSVDGLIGIEHRRTKTKESVSA